MKFVGKDHSSVLILPNDKRGDSMIEKQQKNKFFHFLTQYPIIFVIVIFIVLMAAFVPGFATGRNIQSLFMQMSICYRICGWILLRLRAQIVFCGAG